MAPNESGDFVFLGSLTRYKVRQILGAFSVTQDATAFSLFNRDVSKAIAVLEKRINEEPDDAEAHFLLGRCYIHTGNLSGADTRLESADIENALSFARFPACSSSILPVFRPLFDDIVASG